MKTQRALLGIAVAFSSVVATAHASEDTIGPNGIDSVGLTTATGQPLNGQGAELGQVEGTRPGKLSPQGADNFQNSNPTIIPAAVYIHNVNAPPPANVEINRPCDNRTIKRR